MLDGNHQLKILKSRPYDKSPAQRIGCLVVKPKLSWNFQEPLFSIFLVGFLAQVSVYLAHRSVSQSVALNLALERVLPSKEKIFPSSNSSLMDFYGGGKKKAATIWLKRGKHRVHNSY